jgi:hypothetical protein
MPFHFCMDEVLLIMALIPFIGLWFAKLHAWYHVKFGHKCHEKTCSDVHMEHEKKPFNPFKREPFVVVSKEDMKYLQGTPVPLKVAIPVCIGNKS